VLVLAPTARARTVLEAVLRGDRTLCVVAEEHWPDVVVLGLPSDATPAEIRAAVHAAAAGLSSLPAAMAAAVLPSSDDAHAAEAVVNALTPREREILALLGEGLANKEIGARLRISQHTVKTHLAAIYEKLGVANRAEAVATGLRRGFILL
jgi:DNA-binding NarL/FixJ family response regulator